MYGGIHMEYKEPVLEEEVIEEEPAMKEPVVQYCLSDAHGRMVAQDGLLTRDMRNVKIFSSYKKASAYAKEHKDEMRAVVVKPKKL